MACERPVVAIGSQGYFGSLPPSRMEQGWNHFFGDHQKTRTWKDSKLAEDIISVLQSKHLQTSWGKSGRSFVEKRFNIENVSAKVLSLYQS
jgi:L-malate glycosyltransferase